MQVATLFRESATLLGASMETGGVGGVVGNASDGPGPGPGPGPGHGHGHGHGLGHGHGHGPGLLATQPLHLGLDHFSHPNSNKFKLNMKLESHDDGYETSADLMMSNANNHNDSLKCESLEDPYSFIDEDPMPELSNGQALSHCVPSITVPHPHITLPAPKKRGRKKKIKIEPGLEYDIGMNGTNPPKTKERKKHDRFNGMPEEEVSKRTLPDHLATNLDIIIIGINPGLFAAYKGHHYAGPGNHFWKCLYLSGLTPEQMTADEDYKLLQVGIGFTNMVQRPTKGSADLTRKEIKEGCQILLEKLQRFKPKIAVFNGKLIYEVFSGKKDFSFGRQPDLVDGTNTYMWVMPSSSARCAQLPRAADKVPFYAALKKFRDYLNGIVTSIDDSEVVFTDSRLKSCCESEPKSESLYSSMDLMDISNAIVKRDEVVPCKKKRGRPKKNKTEGEEFKPVVKKPPPTQNVNNCDFPKKKRGRPKKNKCEDMDVSIHERNTRTPISKCFSTPSPIHSPTNFCHMSTALTPSNSSSSGMYGGGGLGGLGGLGGMPALPLQHTQQPYSASPRPHSQPFTHSDLSSEISAAISSDQLGSPAPTSPSLGPPDFDPPTSMPTDDTTECRFSSPAPSSASEQPSAAYPSYHTFGLDAESHRFSQPQPQTQAPPQPQPHKVQDMSSKSLSGLESLVDQIPSIAEGEAAHGLHLGDPAAAPDQYGPGPGQYSGYARASPCSSPVGQGQAYNYSLGNQYYPAGYGGHTSPTAAWGQGFMEHHVPQMWPYGQQFPQTGYGSPGLHVPSPNYPAPVAPPHYYYNAAAPAQPGAHSPHSPHSPPYLHAHTAHMFDRIKPDIGYGSF